MKTHRPPTERPIDHQARKLQADIDRLDRSLRRLAERRRAALGALRKMRDDAEVRFGRPVPLDGMVLDILGQITVEEGDVWKWHGCRNNHNMPTFRTGRTPSAPNGGERSVVRILAVAFGVIKDDEAGILYPRKKGTDDVNPWHRTIGKGKGPGNHKRYDKAA